jgi:hypothetical protein
MSTDRAHLDRRDFLSWVHRGLTSSALAGLMLRDGALQAAPLPGEAADAPPHVPAKARRAIHICLCGAMSHVDSFDYKPELVRLHGKSLVSEERPDVFFGQVGLLRAPDWKFQQRGQSGLWVSDLMPNLGEVADELTVIHSMFAETSNHTPAMFQENTGFRRTAFRCWARGFRTDWAAKPTTCLRSWSFPTRASSPPAGRSTGPAAFCPRGIRAW